MPGAGADDQVQEEGRDTVPLRLRLPVPHAHLSAPEAAERGLGMTDDGKVNRTKLVLGMFSRAW